MGVGVCVVIFKVLQQPEKGSPGAKMIVSEPGGGVDGVEMCIDGVPRPRDGEELILFLYRTPIGFWRARGLGQGRFRVLRDTRTGEAAVHSDLEGAGLVEPLRAPDRSSTDLRGLYGMPLDQFKASVRAVLAGRRNTADNLR